MDISHADIAALEKILMWAEDQALESGEQPPEQEASTPEDMPPMDELEHAPEGIPGEFEPAPKEALDEYTFSGGATKPRAAAPAPAPRQDERKQPVGRRSRY